MTRVVVLGAGISGHTAASFARRWPGRGDTVTVVSPNAHYNWAPSNIWVGVGLMKPSQVTFPLAPIYERHGVEFKQATAREIHPAGDAGDPGQYGRDMKHTFGEIGLAGHWIKILLHHMFLYKARLRPGWSRIPE